MNSNLTKMSTLEAVCLVLILAINRIILNMPQKIIKLCSSASILNVIYISAIAIIFTLIIVKLYDKFPSSDILDVSEFLGGKWLKNIIGVMLVIYFILVSAASIRNFSEILYVIYYDRTSIAFLLAFFIFVAIISNFLGEQSVIRTNVVITVVMLLSLFITFVAVTPNFVIQRIYPLLGYGANQTFYSGLSNVLSFNGLICLYCLRPIISDKDNFKTIAIISVILISVILLFSTACLLLSLAFNAELDDISPVYTLIANNKFGNFIQHPESLFVFTWILSILSYLDVIVMLSIRYLRKITGLKNSKLFIIPVCAMIFIVSLIPKNLTDTHNAEKFLYNYLLFPIVFIILPTILVIANIKYSKKNKKLKDGGS